MLSQLLTLLVYLRSTVNRERQLDVWTQATNIMDAIVQSSGMNKSRLLDEFSNNFFTIPISLRSGVWSYLWLSSARLSVARLSPFRRRSSSPLVPLSKLITLHPSYKKVLFALFEETTQAVKDSGGDKLTRIRMFRDFMSRDQHMESIGIYRVLQG